MIPRLLIAWGLMALCVVIHAAAITAALRWSRRYTNDAARPPRWNLLFIGVAWWIILVHLVEILVWAIYYAWRHAMPDLQTAAYFSAVTYTTTGYGDLVLPPEWRLVGGVEALTGILMCGWSTGFFFAVVNRMLEKRTTTEGAL